MTDDPHQHDAQPDTGIDGGASDPMDRIGAVDAGSMFEAAFGQSRIPMAVTTTAGAFIQVNEAFCSFLGYSADELQSMTFRDTTHPADLAATQAEMDAFAAGEKSEFVLEKRYLSASGEVLHGSLKGIAVRDDAGRLLRVIAQIEDITERQSISAALARRTTVDELTGLTNRKTFYTTLASALADRRRSARRLSVLVVNVDRFHQINAGMGQAAADLLLQEVAARLKAVTRGHDTVGRLGGDEFGVIAAGITNHEDGVALGIKIRHDLGEPYWISGNSVFASVRVGVATAPADGNDPETLIGRATVAATKAKDLSGGWAVHAEGADVASRDALGLVSDLRLAIDRRELMVAYQPIVDGEGRLHCFEALARWHHPGRGPIPPDQFIVMAEHNGLISTLTDRILTAAVGQAAAWSSAASPVRVAVNLSGKLLGHPDLVDRVTRALIAARLAPGGLTIEITETALAEGGDEKIWGALDALRNRGIKISIDDFGTGYSSLAYLKALPVDELKIDRSFVTDLGSDPRSERIVRSIIDLAHSLEMDVVAEGVEDEVVAAQLLRLGVDYLQGYCIARPCDATITSEWLRVHPTTVLTRAATPSRVGHALDILVVDDDIVVRSMLRARLGQRSHRVTEAVSGATALAALSDGTPDLIILDHLMPELTGVESIPQLRGAGYEGPILLFTGASPEQLGSIRFPLDVWPVSKADTATLLRLIDGYTAIPEIEPMRGHQ